MQCSLVPLHCRSNFLQTKANCSAEMWDYTAPCILFLCWFLPFWQKAHTCNYWIITYHRAWHKEPLRTEWQVLRSLYIIQPGHKLSSAIWIQPSRRAKCSVCLVAAKFSNLWLHPVSTQCLIMKDQLEKSLSAEEKKSHICLCLQSMENKKLNKLTSPLFWMVNTWT